jgi:hypothetical protein
MECSGIKYKTTQLEHVEHGHYQPGVSKITITHLLDLLQERDHQMKTYFQELFIIVINKFTSYSKRHF